MSTIVEGDEEFRLDKRVPITVLVVIGLHTFAGIWFAAKLDGRVTNLEVASQKNEEVLERLVRLEVQVEGVSKHMTRIENRLIRIFDKKG